MSLTIVGSVAFDAIETPFGKTDKIIGGAGSYLALASAYFVKQSQIISVVGEDFPQAYLDLLRSRGSNLDGIQIKKGEKTFFWAGRYSADMNSRETLVTELNVLGSFDPIVPASYQNTSYLMLGNLAPTVQKQVVDRMERRPALIVMDTMNFWMECMPEQLKEAIACTDVLCINEEEARQYTGCQSIITAGRTLAASGLKAAIIKRGEYGAMLFGPGGQIFAVPAYPTEKVIDPTGAGDSFAGAFIGYLASKQATDFGAMKQALVYASAMASYTVEYMGTDGLHAINPAELESRSAFIRSMIQI